MNMHVYAKYYYMYVKIYFGKPHITIFVNLCIISYWARKVDIFCESQCELCYHMWLKFSPKTRSFLLKAGPRVFPYGHFGLLAWHNTIFKTLPIPMLLLVENCFGVRTLDKKGTSCIGSKHKIWGLEFSNFMVTCVF